MVSFPKALTMCPRGIDGTFASQELDLLAPFDEITPVAHVLRPEQPAPLPNWLAYGLTRDQSTHVLTAFSHSSYKDAPRQCLAAFDELQSLGLEAFTKKHDPYWDIPLNVNLPQPVIDLPIPHRTTCPPKQDATMGHGFRFVKSLTE